MSLPKLDEWIQEVEQRPGSAVSILRLIASRLRDLTQRNETLLAENIALQDGTKVEEYRKRIAHLEFELDLLKRRYGLDEAALEALTAGPAAAPLVLLAYNAHGRILRLQPSGQPGSLGRLGGELLSAGEPARLLALPSSEEVLLLFTTGRISTCRLEDLPEKAAGEAWDLDQGSLPDEPHAGERLACLAPLSRLPLADFFLQVSRRGCLKKTMTSIADNIFSNRFLGKGAIQKLDQPFDLAFCQKQDRYALVTHEGHLLGVEVDDLTYSAEERLKLDATDHVVAGFTFQPEDTLFCLTQTGKVILKNAASIEMQKASISRGQALIPQGRLEQGVRFIGAAPVKETDNLMFLDESGELTLASQSDLAAAGSFRSQSPLLSFCVLPGQKEQKPQP